MRALRYLILFFPAWVLIKAALGYRTESGPLIWVDARGSGAVLLLPAAYWPAKLLAAWKCGPAGLVATYDER